MTHLVHHFLEESSNRFPEKTAIVHEDIRASYAEVNASANRLAHWMIRKGAQKGQRAALLMENSLEYVVSYYAVLKAGMIAAPLSFELKPDRLKPLVKELEPSFLLVSARCERVLRATPLDDLPVNAVLLSKPKLDWSASDLPVHPWSDAAVEGNNADNPDLEIGASDLASIIYTSGSTGEPKGVMLTHGNIGTNTQSICQYLQLTDADIQMVVLPFFYVMGKSLLNTHVAVGGTVVINNKFAFPATVVNQMIEERVTGFSGVPSTYAYLLHRSPLAASKDKLSELRYCSQAGGHMARQTKQDLRKALPDHTQIVVMYGATEASARLTYLEPDQFESKMGSIGKAIPGVKVKVLLPDGTEAPQGETGELVAGGSNIMQGYWKDPDASKKVLDAHGYHTGDLGYQDEDGYFFVTGRKDNLLKVGGHRINPQEVEDVVMESGLVIESVVVGIPDELLGNKLIAVATPKEEGLDSKAILTACDGKLPKYKMPSEVRLVKALPKNVSGKINRDQIVEMLKN